MKKEAFNLNNPKLEGMKNILLETFENRHIRVIDIQDSRADFFTKKLPLNLSNIELGNLNEMVWCQVQDKEDMCPGFYWNPDENFRDELLDDVYILFAMDERDENADMIPQAFLKVDMYTSDMSLITVAANYEIGEIDPYSYIDDKGFSISDMIDDFMKKHPRSTRDEFDDWFRDYASDLLDNDPEYIKVGRFEFVTAEISEINEYQLPGELKKAIIENIARNNEEYKNIHSVREFISDLRQKALAELNNPKSSIARYAERHSLNLKTLRENIIRTEQEDRAMDNRIHVERSGDEYIVTGRFKGSYAELAAEIEQLTNDMRTKERDKVMDAIKNNVMDGAMAENVVLEFSVNGRHAGLTQWLDDGYNLYVQISDDVAEMKPTMDEIKSLCNLPDEAEVFCIDERLPEGCGLMDIENKPAVGIMIEGITDPGEVVKMAYKVAADVLQSVNTYDLAGARECPEIESTEAIVIE